MSDCLARQIAAAVQSPRAACKSNVAQTSLFWIRDVFWPQYPRCWDQNTSQIQILRHFEKNRGAIFRI